MCLNQLHLTRFPNVRSPLSQLSTEPFSSLSCIVTPPLTISVASLPQTLSLHGWSRLRPSCLLLPPLSFGLLIFTHMPTSRHFWMLIFATFSQLRYPPPSTWISTRTSNSQLSQPSVHRRKNATALCGRTVVCLCVEAAGNTSAILRSGIRGNPTP